MRGEEMGNVGNQHRLPALVALAVAMAAVLLVKSPMNSRAVTTNALQTRATSCSSLDFHPADSDTWYDYVGTRVYHKVTNNPASQNGSGFFICDPHLPQSARVTKVQFTVYDNFNGDQVQYCALARNTLAQSTGGYQVLAQVPATGSLNTPARVRLTDTTISYPTIDNTKFGYWLQCQVTAEPDTDQYTGIYGADVIYTIDPTRG
jgi:hypothetical protein